MTHKIVFYTDGYAPGGAERVLLTLLAGLDRTKWEPTLVYYPQASFAPFVDHVRRIGVRLLPVDWGTGGRIRRVAAEVPALVRYLRAERPVILHANMTWPVGCRYAFLAGALARVPVVATEHLLGVLGFVLCLCLAPFLPVWLHVPVEEQSTATWLIILMGAELGVAMPCTTGTSVLQGL